MDSTALLALARLAVILGYATATGTGLGNPRVAFHTRTLISAGVLGGSG
jgi:hypothetical protein